MIEAQEIHDDVRRKGITSLHGLTFSDVLILPECTDVRPDQVDLTSEILPNLSAGMPVWSAPMTSIWSHEMTVALAECGALAPLHRDLCGEELTKEIDKLAKTKITKNGFFHNVKVGERPPIIVSTSPFDEPKIEYLIKHGAVDYIILDTVQPYSSAVINAVKKHSLIAPNRIIVGNIATADAAAVFTKSLLSGN
jgi:IMP dehydrogenase